MEFQKVTSLTALPGECRVCGSSSKEWYLDTSHSEEFYGAVVYCCDCVAHMAQVCGFITPAQKAALDAAYEAMENRLTTTQMELETLKEFKDGFINLARDLGYRSAADPDAGLVAGFLETVVPRKEAIEGEGTGLGSGTGTTLESSDDEGVGELRSDGVHDASLPSPEFRF